MQPTGLDALLATTRNPSEMRHRRIGLELSEDLLLVNKLPCGTQVFRHEYRRRSTCSRDQALDHVAYLALAGFGKCDALFDTLGGIGIRLLSTMSPACS